MLKLTVAFSLEKSPTWGAPDGEIFKVRKMPLVTWDIGPYFSTKKVSRPWSNRSTKFVSKDSE
jgi:hypothetical protein